MEPSPRSSGMKCLPACKLGSADGNAVHDWHAEVLAMRAFNRFLLDECVVCARDSQSQAVEVADASADKPFRIRHDVKLHMYCSEAPCGDASMELVMAAQEDSSAWNDDLQGQQGEATAAALPGRGYFSRVGVVRRKPGRGDAPPTLSKSCSDKMALRQCTSLLSSLTSLLVDPSTGYLDSVVLPESQFRAAACQRAFSGRMAALEGAAAAAAWPGGYAFAPFRVETTAEEFALSRRAVAARTTSIAPSNLAAVWTASGVEETLLGGVVQGRRPFEEKGASAVSRRRMWAAAMRLAPCLVGAPELLRCLRQPTYGHVKDCELLADRRQVKRIVRQSALAGWIPNQGDSDFSIVHGY